MLPGDFGSSNSYFPICMKKAHCHIFIVNEAAIQLIEDTIDRKVFIESSKYKFVASQKCNTKTSLLIIFQVGLHKPKFMHSALVTDALLRTWRPLRLPQQRAPASTSWGTPSPSRVTACLQSQAQPLSLASSQPTPFSSQRTRSPAHRNFRDSGTNF